MATISFTLPVAIATQLNLNVPGFAAASGGGNTLTLQVPALPGQVAAGLNDAGIQVAPEAASGAPVAIGAPAAVPAGAPVGLAQIAPAGLVPQGAAVENPDLAAVNAFLQGRAEAGAAAIAFFQNAAANPPPANVSEIAGWAAAQQQAFIDYFTVA